MENSHKLKSRRSKLGKVIQNWFHVNFEFIDLPVFWKSKLWIEHPVGYLHYQHKYTVSQKIPQQTQSVSSL